MKKYIWILIFGFWISAQAAWADGLAVDPSQSILGARQIGIGRAGTALNGDPWSLFMNPAGLADITYPKISATSRKIFFDETQYLCLGGAVPTQWGTWGFGIIGTGIANSYQTRRDAETDRIVLNPSKEAISSANNVYLLSYSKPVHKNLALGANLKFYDQGFNGGSSAHATGYGLDLGAMYNLFPYLNLGIDWQNFLSSGLKWTGGAGATDTLGGFIKLGGDLSILGKEGTSLKKHDQKLNGFLDIDLPRSVLSQNGNPVYHLGFEWSPLTILDLRAGYDSNLNLSYGVGFTNWGFRFDYAYALSPYGAGDNPHYFTLSYIGDLMKVFTKKLIDEKIALKFYSIKDRQITTQESLSIFGLAVYDKTFDEITSWVIPSISQKDDHRIVTEEANLVNFKINERLVDVKGSFEVEEKLYAGRNVFYMQGAIPGKGTTYESVRILRIHPFKDVNELHWAFEPISMTSTLKVIEGYPDHHFKPGKGITRAELVALLLRSKGISLEAGGHTVFTDLKEDSWSTPYIVKGVKIDIVTGYPDQTFKPNKVLSRAEGVAIISRFAGLVSSIEANPAFPDLKAGFWANKFIEPAHKAGLLNYLSGKHFEPNKELSRAEAAEILYQTKSIKERVNLFWETGKLSEEVAVPPQSSPLPQKNKKP